MSKRGKSPLWHTMSSPKAPLNLRIALSKWARQWKAAYYETRNPWPNRCIDCSKPLCCGIWKYNRCVACWHDDRVITHWKETAYCLICEEEHKCLVCDCSMTWFNFDSLCTCPRFEVEEDWSSESTEPYISCGTCGGNAYGCDYERWGFCSRRCLPR